MGRSRGEPIRRCTSQAGAGMVEVLVAIVLASVTVVALAQALLTLVVTSGSTADRQQLAATVNGYGESLKQVGWIACGDTPAPGAQAYADEEAASAAPFHAPHGVTLSVTRVEFWNDASASFQDTCPGDGTGAQRVSVRAASSRGTMTAQVVKVPW